MVSAPRVAITGFGAITPVGDDVATISASLRERTSGVRPIAAWSEIEGLGPRIAGTVATDVSSALPRKHRRTMGRVAHLAVSATRSAIHAACIDDDLLHSGRVGLAIGSTTGSAAATLTFYENILNHGIRANRSTTFPQAMGHTCAANAALCFGITGRVWAPNSACTSGSQAIGLAYDTLRLGEQDIMLCGGAEEVHFTSVAVFDLAGAASKGFNDAPEATPRPFDKRRDGMVIGEGAGILVLERWEHAVARGVPILGELFAFNTGCDGHHITAPAAAGMQACMEGALRSADLAATDIGYINAHATGTEAGDPTEAFATAAVFGDRVPVSSTKGMTGHTLGACGGIESIFTLIAMAEGFVPGTRNLEEADANCAGPWLVQQSSPRNFDIAMNNNFAFGGINTSLIFGRG